MSVPINAAAAGACNQPVAAHVASAAMSARPTVNAVTPTTMQIARPLIIGEDQLDTLVDALPALLDVTRQEALS